MIKLFIQGYGNNEVKKKAHFAGDDETHLPLFLSYSDFDVPVGTIIKFVFGHGIFVFVNLEIVNVTLGRGELIQNIPRGYKSIILVKGTKEDILKLKGFLTEVSTWNKSPNDYMAVNVGLEKLFNQVSKLNSPERPRFFSSGSYSMRSVTVVFDSNVDIDIALRTDNILEAKKEEEKAKLDMAIANLIEHS